MAITLYGDLNSRAHRVAWMLKELQLPFKHVPTGFQDGSTHQPEFLQINPNARVPALIDGDLVLFESLAINLYLARCYGGGTLGPDGMVEEAQATQWSLWVANEVEKTLLFAAANCFLFAPDQRNPDEAQMALRKLERPFAVLESRLRGQRWLLGSRFTVADLNVCAVMTLLPLAGIDVSNWPAMQDWLHHCLERPAAADWKPIRFTIPRPATQLGLLQMFV
ncbi:glutathione S-transferase family protein [Pseudomonas sp. MWU13-2105]|uniref:glutathione S-transferase family protein n=1 Tax=Pseudomonas sp. MWU13-2105 TaxID=2935074 RepID=UPI00200E8A7F|nr:glutathione S-transferase family protein [Pseudomonas sp. MWU13-2105]